MSTDAAVYLTTTFDLFFNQYGFEVIDDVDSVCIATSPLTHLILFLAFDRNSPNLFFGDGRTTTRFEASWSMVNEGKWYGCTLLEKLINPSFSIRDSVLNRPSSTRLLRQISDERIDLLSRSIPKFMVQFSNANIDRTIDLLESYRAELSEAFDELGRRARGE